MYFSECERLANDHRDLQPIIAKVDALLRGKNPSDLLRVDIISGFLEEKASRVSGVFELLVDEGVLRKENYHLCLYCGNLISNEQRQEAFDLEESLQCSQCDKVLEADKLKTVCAYRLTAGRKIAAEQHDGKTTEPSLPTSRGRGQILSEDFLADPFGYTPLLHYYSRDKQLLDGAPFRGKRVFFLLHFLRDIIPFTLACQKLGLQLENAYYFYKDYFYPQRDAVANWLRAAGATVASTHEIEQYLSAIEKLEDEQIGILLIVEDGGFIGPSILLRHPILIVHTIGVIEQTTRGIRNIKAAIDNSGGIRFPIISIPHSELKRKFEPQYIAEAVVGHLNSFLPDIAIRGKSGALLGYGTIGEKLASLLRTRGVNLAVYDSNATNRLSADQAGFPIAGTPEEAVRNKHLVFGATGQESLSASVIANLSNNTYLISASSEQYEIDVGELEQRSRTKEFMRNDQREILGTTYFLRPDDRQIHLLANSYPINFWGMDSMPGEAADLILTLILLSAAELAIGRYGQKGINEIAVNEIADEYSVPDKFLDFHKK